MHQVCLWLFLASYLTSCSSVMQKNSHSKMAAAYDSSDYYVLRAMLKESNKIGFEVCEINKKHRRFIAQNQFRITGCVPAYLNSGGKDVTFLAKEFTSTFSAKELTVAKEIIAKMDKQRQKIQLQKAADSAGRALLTLGVSAGGGVIGAATSIWIPSSSAPPLLLAVLVGMGAGAFLGSFVQGELEREFRPGVISADRASLDKIAAKLYTKRAYVDTNDLAEITYYWNSLITLDTAKMVPVTSVVQHQQLLGWYLSQAIPSAKLDSYCLPKTAATNHDMSDRVLSCLPISEPKALLPGRQLWK
ncbi:MAG: hypothetical protein OXC44_04755 [Proteobacteria bacterium]|nr:hypothetical protein [Pseudomonadota bacterium]